MTVGQSNGPEKKHIKKHIKGLQALSRLMSKHGRGKCQVGPDGDIQGPLSSRVP